MSKVHRIVCAANKYQDGTVICSARHFDPVMHVVLAQLKEEKLGSHTQGFIDNNGVFWGRESAFWIALKANQIRHKTGGDKPVLYSEDLY